MKDRLKVLAQWLQQVETSDFGYDPYHDGRLESFVAESQVETCHKIGGYLEEILTMDDEQIKNELND
tara:strand:- start:146 stop:346 length:201 start_codon:yes stop_codon:yes gene_type:complete